MRFTFTEASWLPCAAWTQGLGVEAGNQGAVLEIRGGLGGWTREVAGEGREKNADVRFIWRQVPGLGDGWNVEDETGTCQGLPLGSVWSIKESGSASR